MTAEHLDELLRHLRLYYSDYSIANDMDCVLAEARDEREREALELYAKMRRKAPDFRRTDARHNNHSRIPLEALAVLGEQKTLSSATCQSCGMGFLAQRNDAKTCSARCRRRRSRRPNVTLESAGGTKPQDRQNEPDRNPLTSGDARLSVTSTENEFAKAGSRP